MAHGARRLKEKLCNTPHLISPSSFDSVISYLENREESFDVKADSDYETVGVLSFNEDTGVGVIEINGPLTYKSTGMEMYCGGTSYTSILESMNELVEEGAHTVVLSVDSGGGEAYSMTQTSSELRRLADEAGIKLIAYVDGMAASAAYGLSVSAHEIIVNPDAEVGSIGVVVRLINDSKALEQAGYERSFVYAGDSKVPFADDGSFRKEFIQDIQYKVDVMYENFTGYVSEMRNLPVEKIKATQANTFMAKDAVELGLADKIMTRLEFFDYLATVAEEQTKGGNGNMLQKLFSTKKENAEMANMEALQAQLVEAQEKLASVSAEFEQKLAEMSSEFENKLQTVIADKEKAESALAQSVKEAADKKVADRKAQIAAVIGDIKAEEMIAVVAGMDDASFDVVLKSMGVAVEKSTDTDMFKEVGVSGKQETSVEEDLTVKALKKHFKF